MHYLTVPDMLWINLQVTGSPQGYDFATLEEATFYQYSNGKSKDIAKQAGRFLTGFVRLQPFASGNEATAFVGCLAFLEMNGHTIAFNKKDASKWAKEVWAKPEAAMDTVKAAIVEHHGHDLHGVPNTGSIVGDILARHRDTISGFEVVPA